MGTNVYRESIENCHDDHYEGGWFVGCPGHEVVLTEYRTSDTYRLEVAEIGKPIRHTLHMSSREFGMLAAVMVRADDNRVVWVVEQVNAAYEAPAPLGWCINEEQAREFAAAYWREKGRHEHIAIYGRSMGVRAWHPNTRERPGGFSFRGDADEAHEAGWLDENGRDIEIDTNTGEN